MHDNVGYSKLQIIIINWPYKSYNSLIYLCYIYIYIYMCSLNLQICIIKNNFMTNDKVK